MRLFATTTEPGKRAASPFARPGNHLPSPPVLRGRGAGGEGHSISRHGYTLIELLTVIAIIAILTSLGGYAFFSNVEGRRRGNTEVTIQTVHKILQQHWSHVVNEAKKDSLPQVVIDAAGGNHQRARVLWTKYRLLEAFPVKFSDVTSSPITPYIPSNQLRYLTTYSKLLNSKTGPTSPQSESSACLLMALSVNRGGAGLSPDLLSTMAADTDGDGLKELIDGWGQPIRFFRFPTQYAGLQNANPGKAGRDPLDPEGLLLNPTWQGSPSVVPSIKNVQAYEALAHKINNGSTGAFYTVPTLVSSKGTGNVLFNLDDSMTPAGTVDDYIYSFASRN